MTIRLGPHRDCVADSSCVELWEELAVLFGSGRYNYPASILELDDVDTYLAEHRTARKRAQRASRLGYYVSPLHRDLHEDDIFAINTSLPERQGRPMTEGYRERQTFSPLPAYPCPRHRIETWGVWTGEQLVGYLVLYVSGEMAMVSQILGHGDHLENDIMYLLVTDVLRHQPRPLTVFYNRHDGGTDGLRYFKERLGFAPERVAWAA